MEKVKCVFCYNESVLVIQEVDLENSVIHYTTLCASCNKAYAKYVIEHLSVDEFNDTFDEFSLREINDYMTRLGVIQND